MIANIKNLTLRRAAILALAGPLALLFAGCALLDTLGHVGKALAESWGYTRYWVGAIADEAVDLWAGR